jgi:hypothetical protein
MRFALPTPRAFNFAALICGSICTREPTAICVLPAMTSINRRPAALERHVHDVEARLLLEELARQVLEAADAAVA